MCLDETSKQLVGETRQSRPPRPGSVMAYDYEYQRNGVSNLFMLFAPLEGWRTGGSDGPTHQSRLGPGWSSDWWTRTIPTGERIVLVMDNLNTHHPSLAVRGVRAVRSAAHRRTAGDPTTRPKHGSWLNMAEIEIGVLDRQCLGPPDPQPGNPGAGNRGHGNTGGIGQGFRVDWRFTTADARIKLKSLYPSIQQ